MLLASVDALNSLPKYVIKMKMVYYSKFYTLRKIKV